MKTFNWLALVMFLLFSCTTQEQEKQESKKQAPFMWENATVYFLLTDRFNNGDTTNDLSYGRKADSAPLRGFMGGDIKGVTQKVEEGYFTDLGVNAIWLTPVVEQIHGSVDEGTGESYGFHGYWTKDWTALDQNFGSMEDYAELVKVAHAKGIRVIMDVVMNHTGPVTELDPVWPDSWVRAGPSCTYQNYESTVECTLVENLPDILTYSEEEVELPPSLLAKWKEEGRYEQEMAELDAFFVRTGYPRAPKYYLIKWLSDYVRAFGIDGFRLDTVKHIQAGVWGELYAELAKAFEEWKKNNPEAVLDENPFYMVGEVYGYSIHHGLNYDYDGDTAVNFFAEGMKSMINFSFKYEAKEKSHEELFTTYARILQNGELKEHSVLNYLSSHDDGSPFDANRDKVFEAANLLMMTPGASQIYYGDETARKLNVEEANGDAKLRSFMNWEELEANVQREGYTTQEILKHYQLLGKFRRDHPAIGAGSHQMITESPYVFSRTLEMEGFSDQVLVSLEANLSEVKVGDIFKEGAMVQNAYTGEIASVTEGALKFEKASRILLLEAVE